MANYPQELVQDAVCQIHTGHMTGLWFLPTRPLRLNTNEWMNMAMYENSLYAYEFLNIISYLCMSPPYHEANMFLDATAQNRVSFSDYGFIISI